MIKSNKLRGKIVECGFTQREVAEYLRVGADTFGDWLNKGKIRSDYLENLAHLLGIEDFNFFFND